MVMNQFRSVSLCVVLNVISDRGSGDTSHHWLYHERFVRTAYQTHRRVRSQSYDFRSRHAPLAIYQVIYGLFLTFAQVGKICQAYIPTSRPDRLTGPGNCLGVIAAKTGPTAVRGQYYGVAAATGKLGAFIGTWGMPLSTISPPVVLTCATDDIHI